MVLHVNLYFGWIWILLGLLAGASIGLFFHDAGWLGGYDSWRRRMVRLGHISFLGTGLLNLAFVLTVDYLKWAPEPRVAAVLYIVGAVSMPVICFLSAWRKPWRHLFFVPVLSLIGATLELVVRGML